jgi:hypothetical protein
MTSLDEGTYGAKVQSWQRVNPRKLLRQLLGKYPKDDRAKLFKLFTEMLDNSDERDDYYQVIVWYWFVNNHHSLTMEKVGAAEDHRKLQHRQAEVAVARDRVQKLIEREAQIKLLDMVLPNGKRLRDCTGNECRALGAKVGSWLLKVSQELRPEQVVGDALTEKQVRKIYGSI